MKTKHVTAPERASSEGAASVAKTTAVKPAEPKRTPWMGGITKDELAKPGGILLAMLTARANELGQQLGTMAEELNCTYGYISQLRSGIRKTQNISDEFATACAQYLGVPRMTVLMAAGRVRPEDVYEDPHEAMSTVPRALQFMQGDAHYGPMMPNEVFDVSLPLQFFIVQLYEAATGRKLLPGSFDAETVSDQIQQFTEYRKKLKAEVDSDRERKAIEASDRKSAKVLGHAPVESLEEN